MTVLVMDIGPAPGHPGLDILTNQMIDDAHHLIAELNFGVIIGPVGTINSKVTCRIDRQGPPQNGSNTQVQINGISGRSSISTCIVEGSVYRSMTDWPSGLRQHQEGWLLRRVRVALTKSLLCGHIFMIKGSFADEDTPCNLRPRVKHGYRVDRPADPSKPRGHEGCKKKRRK